MLGPRFATAVWLALFTLFGVTAAVAADYVPPPPPVVVQPPPQECCSNWYLRGQVGVGMTEANQMEYLRNPANSNDFTVDTSSVGDSTFFGGGVGYMFNNWLRFDATVEYRTKARVDAFGSYTAYCVDGGGNPVAPCIDTYQGYIKSWILLANAYIDLGTWDCWTPFVGFGAGGAYNTLADFSDLNTTNGGRGFGRNSSEWHLAWALYAGLTYNVSDSLKVDLSYRYLNYGSITDAVDCKGGCNADSYKFGDLHSNDFMLSLRVACCDVDTKRARYYAPPPAYTPPPPVYRPPPAYQPPLRSRG